MTPAGRNLSRFKTVLVGGPRGGHLVVGDTRFSEEVKCYNPLEGMGLGDLSPTALLAPEG